MAEVGKVPGPTGPQEAGKGRPATHAQKFKEMMKVQKVDEVDEERKKKRKRSEETEAETKAEAQEAIEGAAPKKPPSPLEILPKGKKELTAGKPERAGALEPKQIEEPHFTGEEENMEAFSSQQVEREKKAESASQLRSPRPQDKKVEAAKAKGIAEHREAEYRAAEKSKKDAAAAEKEKIRVHREEEKQIEKTAVTRHEQKEEVEEVAEAALPPTAQVAPFETKKTEEKKKKVEEAAERSAALPQAPSPDTMQVPTGAQAGPTAPAVYATLHPTLFDLFERMVGVMTVMTTAGITETTLTLSAPEYAHSVFFGAQVIIKEFATAPKAYNVQIVASPQGVALVQKNAGDLMSAFQAGNYNFKVNRLEAVLSSERPIFRRKERVSRDEEEEAR